MTRDATAAPRSTGAPPHGGRSAHQWWLALAGGILWGGCFEKIPLPWLAPFALVPLIVLTAGRRPLLFGWLYGTVSWVVALRWLVPTLRTHGELAPAVAAFSLLVLCLYLGGYTALFAALAGRLWGRGSLPGVVFGLPAVWVVCEWLRGTLFTGFPWNLAAYAWTEVPGALPVASWIGAYGVSYLLLLSAVVLVAAWRARTWMPLSILLPLAALLGFGVLLRPSAPSPDVGSPFHILQPNSPIIAFEDEAIWRQYRRIQDLSAAACDRQPGLLLWPESAAWPFSYGSAAHLVRDIGQLAGRGCPVLFNSVSREGDSVFNSALLVGAAGVEGRYDKRRLVPWGEYVPLADLLPFIDQLARQAGRMQPGRSEALLAWGEESIGMAICYEVIFPSLVAAQTRAGATVLATVTNDAWYGDTAAPWQHFRAARFRAAENRRPMLRAAITGVSGWIDRSGRVVQSLGVEEAGRISGHLQGGEGLTPYARAPWVVVVVCGLLALWGLWWPTRRAGP